MLSNYVFASATVKFNKQCHWLAMVLRRSCCILNEYFDSISASNGLSQFKLISCWWHIQIYIEIGFTFSDGISFHWTSTWDKPSTILIHLKFNLAVQHVRIYKHSVYKLTTRLTMVILVILPMAIIKFMYEHSLCNVKYIRNSFKIAINRTENYSSKIELYSSHRWLQSIPFMEIAVQNLFYSISSTNCVDWTYCHLQTA